MDEEAKKCQEEIDVILQKYGYQYSCSVSFPQYQILPDTVVLASKIMIKEGMKVVPILVKKEEAK